MPLSIPPTCVFCKEIRIYLQKGYFLKCQLTAFCNKLKAAIAESGNVIKALLYIDDNAVTVSGMSDLFGLHLSLYLASNKPAVFFQRPTGAAFSYYRKILQWAFYGQTKLKILVFKVFKAEATSIFAIKVTIATSIEMWWPFRKKRQNWPL